jgi:hypothetical protein
LALRRFPASGAERRPRAGVDGDLRSTWPGGPNPEVSRDGGKEKEKMDKENGKWWSRRVSSTAVWCALLNVAFFVCLGKPDGLSWFSEYGKFLTFGLVFLVSGLTLTDIFLPKRGGSER